MHEAENLWWDVEKRSFHAYLKRDIGRGIEILTEFLDSEVSSPFRARALGNRAELLLGLGKTEEASQDLLQALKIADGSSYTRFTNEFALGALYEQLGHRELAIEYLLKAVGTALQEGKTSVGGVLVRLLRLVPMIDFSEEEDRLVVDAVRHSWRLLNLEGEPDISDIQGVAETLLRESSRPR